MQKAIPAWRFFCPRMESHRRTKRFPGDAQPANRHPPATSYRLRTPSAKETIKESLP